MHTEKQKIFDEYAKSKGYENWHFLQIFTMVKHQDSESLTKHIFAACDLVQKEQQKRIAENAVIEPKGMMTKVDKSSILSENNLIK